MSLAQSIQKEIYTNPVGWVFCAQDFYDTGASSSNIDVVLHRLSKTNFIRRLGYGLYDRPVVSKLLGNLAPSIQNILAAYSRRLNQSFVLAPPNAANILGLTTQVPAKLVYLTDGRSHTIQICGQDIYFLHAAPKKMPAPKNPIGIIIQALQYFGSQGAPDTILRKVALSLNQSDVNNLLQVKNHTLKSISSQIDRISRFANV